jgi:hypothetical protein
VGAKGATNSLVPVRAHGGSNSSFGRAASGIVAYIWFISIAAAMAG